MADPNDELEPMNGPHDWAEAIRQNPDQGIADLPAEAEDAAAGALADEAEDHLRWTAELGED